MIQTNKYLNLLKWIWLSENSSIIYLSLLDKWISSISEISNNTLLHRVQIYRLLPYLIEYWFIFKTIKWKRNLYSPCSPEKIKDEYNRLFNNNKSIIDEMNSKYNNINKKTNITLNKWLKWIQNTYNDMINSLNKWDIFYRITSEVDVDKINNFYIPKGYKKKRDEKEIERYIIMTEKTAKRKKNKLEREIKIIDDLNWTFDDNIIFTIYKNKLSLIDFNTETSIIIESNEFSFFLKKVFKILFKKL